ELDALPRKPAIRPQRHRSAATPGARGRTAARLRGRDHGRRVRDVETGGCGMRPRARFVTQLAQTRQTAAAIVATEGGGLLPTLGGGCRRALDARSWSQ